MSQLNTMLQPLLPLDVTAYREYIGNTPAQFTTCEFVTGTNTGVRLLPNGCIDLLMPLDGQCELLLLGAFCRPKTVSLLPECHYFNVRFAPGVFYWNKPMPPSALYEKEIHLLHPGDYSPIMPEKLARFESLEKKTSYLIDNILPCLSRQCLLPLVSHMLDRIAETRGTIQVEELAEELNYSTRHINRLFIEALGYGPKSFCRFVRVQCTLSEIRKKPGRNNSAFIQKTSYSDQAHFQREFKSFTGLTPKQYIRLTAGILSDL